MLKDKKITKAVITCGGYSTRFLPISKAVSKEMLPIIDKPVIHYVLRELEDAGITDVLILVGRGRETLLNYLDVNYEIDDVLAKNGKGDFPNFFKNLNITYRRVPMPRGAADALYHAKNFAGGEHFILAYSDNVFFGGNPTLNLINDFEKYGKCALCGVKVQEDDAHKYGVIKFDAHEIAYKDDDACYNTQDALQNCNQYRAQDRVQCGVQDRAQDDMQIRTQEGMQNKVQNDMQVRMQRGMQDNTHDDSVKNSVHNNEKDGAQGVVKEIIEKPRSKPPSCIAVMGRYILSAEIFSFIKEEMFDEHRQGEICMVDQLNKFAERGNLRYIVTDSSAFDVGDAHGLIDANTYMRYGIDALKFLQSCK